MYSDVNSLIKWLQYIDISFENNLVGVMAGLPLLRCSKMLGVARICYSNLVIG